MTDVMSLHNCVTIYNAQNLVAAANSVKIFILSIRLQLHTAGDAGLHILIVC